MLHIPDDFLNAIASAPTDRTLRLVFADWLNEQGDPRSELIRVEEEMRTLPVFADRFWELKPRRNELRTLAGSEWCKRMCYGTDCEPVFRHGIPDGWRERWRLIREFTERWHHVPMGDVGGRQQEIAEVEARLGKKLPPSVCEWVAVERKMQQNWPSPFCGLFIDLIPGQPAVSLWAGDGDEIHSGIRDADLHHPDPPVYLYSWDEEFGTVDDLRYSQVLDTPSFESVTDIVLGTLIRLPRDLDHYYTVNIDNKPQLHDIRATLEAHFPVRARLGNIDIYEMDNVFGSLPARPTEHQSMMTIQVASHVPLESLPPFLQVYVHRPDY